MTKFTFSLVLLTQAVSILYGQEYTVQVLDLRAPDVATICQDISLVCNIIPSNSLVVWSFNGENVTDNRVTVKQNVQDTVLESTFSINCVDIQDVGNYTCHVSLPENNEINHFKTHFLNVTLEGEVFYTRDERARVGKAVSLVCEMKGYPIHSVHWRIVKSGLSDLLPQNINTLVLNETYIITHLNFTSLSKHDNGSYACVAVGPNGVFNKTVNLFVLDKPHVNFDLVKAVGSSLIYVNWTVYDGNEPIKNFHFQTMKKDSKAWVFYPKIIRGNNTSCLIEHLDKNTEYQIRMSAENVIGKSPEAIHNKWVLTLDKDPMFIPEVKLKGTTFNSLNIGWNQPPPDVQEFIQYYQLELTVNGTKREAIQSVSTLNEYLFVELTAATTYQFRMSACSEYTKKCGNWSVAGNGTTMDGTSDPPENLTVQCRFDNISHTSFVLTTWRPPSRPYGKILHYNVVLVGQANFRNERGVNESKTFGPRTRSTSETSGSARFDLVPPNTNYSVRVSAVTRSRKSGKDAVSHCSMPPTIPEKDKISRFQWNKIQAENGRWLFKLELPRVSERNGVICCYMVYLVKLKPGQLPDDLPSPEDLPTVSYQEAHNTAMGGAYIAETFNSESLDSEISLGDGRTSSFVESPCRHCITFSTKTVSQPERTTELALAEIHGLKVPVRTTENYESSSEYELDSTTVITPFRNVVSLDLINTDEYKRSERSSQVDETTTVPSNDVNVYDGVLDINSNYTGFIRVIVHGENGNLMQAYSNYFKPAMFPGPTLFESPRNSPELTIALHVLIGLFVIVILLIVVLLVLHSYTKNVAEERGIEMTFTYTLMHLCRNVTGRHVPVSSSPPDMPPIAKEDLVEAVAERHRDSDYGFQHEFEMLPDRFPDRTTRASESRENFYKNRYPDIKAYDQTRVKLSQVDGFVGSDYINANFVVGYKERKKFICAQGPMDNTVNDFWRMVWEQHLEMILMLTNLEEYSKSKCAKYWPDKSAGDKRFGDYVVSHVQEKKYSDYIVRELKVKQSTDVEKDKNEERSIMQYHYLVWKDFQAPDHPSGILKFIKRMNEDYSLEKGPILIHCSAGVGRTGTLVALDSLVQQLNEENQVGIFNTVCDLRHQRNFLVQSLKQYIFVYKSLVEVSLRGDTDRKVTQLKATVDRLRKKENGKDKCLLEEEFEKLELNVEERNKTCSVGNNEENKGKNRTQDVIPYDRNRVMLSPIPGKEHSTYINASFIESYDNSESFIIAQDPLLVSLSDFWRMISEHCVSTLVMMSDLGDGPKKCIRYWPEPDDESTYDNIKVKYIQSESCPYYTRREFAVTNIKTDDSIITTQFQYNGWPTVEGEVPEVTRGLIELVDQTQENHNLCVSENNLGPIAVHCNWGADRSSIFVALSILIQQLKNEKSVDIFSVVRKLRSQRQLMVKTYAQYEFLHRAVVNYADLHHLVENGTTSPI